MPWITNSLKGRLIKIELYNGREMFMAKYYTMYELTPENYWKALIRIAHYCTVESLINKQCSWLKGFLASTPLGIVKEYQKQQVIIEVKQEHKCTLLYKVGNSLLHFFRDFS